MRRRSLPVIILAGLLTVPVPVFATEAPGESASGVSVAVELPAGVAAPSSSATSEAAGEGGIPAATARPAAPDFLIGDWQLQEVPWERLRMNGGPLHPVRTLGPQDEDGVPMRPLGPGRSLVYNPTVIAQQGMKRLDAYVRTGKPAHLRYARRFARVLEDIASGRGERRWQPHPYDQGIHEKGWVNANSHGLVLSFLSRFDRVADAPGKLHAGERLMAAFQQREGDRRWVATVTPAGYVWFEHWPDGRFHHTLNAHLNALFGLYDYWRQTGSPLAEQYFLGGTRTVRDKLHRFRRKDGLSRYSLPGPVGSLHYHETHIEQLRILALMTGDEWFAEQARLFKRDERRWRAAKRD